MLPKFNQGQPPALTFVRPVDSRNRLVIRLWQVAEVSDARKSPRSRRRYGADLTAEQSRTEFEPDCEQREPRTSYATPLQAIDQAVRGGR